MSDCIHIQHLEHMDRGLGYAESCFETFRVIDGEIFAWASHWQRLCSGMSAFGFSFKASLEQAVWQTCLEQAAHCSTDCLLRLSCSGGDADWGLTKTSTAQFWVQTTAFHPAPAIHTFSTTYPFALQAKTAKFTADYAETLRAIQIWKQQRPHTNPQQYIICKDNCIISGLTANILLYVQGQWLTPQGDGVLNGVIREFLRHQGLIKALSCPTTLLDSCESIVLINSGHFLRPVASINQRILDYNHPALAALHHALASNQGVKLEHL